MQGEAELELLLGRVDDAIEEALYMSPEDRAERARRRQREQQRRQQRRRPADPLGQASAQAYGAAMRLYAQARAGEYKTLSEASKRRLLTRFIRLLTASRISVQQRNKLQGNFDEFLRTPAAVVAQPVYRAGGPLLPGQARRGTAQPDYSKPGSSDAPRRSHVNLKSDRIDLLSRAAAVARARAHADQALRNSIQLPNGEPIIIRYTYRPAAEVQQAMLQELFKPGSPISQVHFGTTVFRNPQMG